MSTISLDGLQPAEEFANDFPEPSYNEEDLEWRMELDGEGLAADNYAVSYFNNQSYDLSDVAGIEIAVRNNRKEAVKCNLLLSTYSEEVLLAGDGARIFMISGKNMSVVYAQYGCFVIPPEFKGKIYIPLSALSTTEGEKPAELTGIYGFGFTFVLSRDEKIDLSFSEIHIYQDTDNGIPAYFEIQGDEHVLNPIIGESQSYYSLVFYDKRGNVCQSSADISYGIADGRDNTGLEISSEGCLTVNTSAEEGEYYLFARTLGYTVEKKIDLEVSWTNKQMTENGYNASMVFPDEVAEVVASDSLFMNDTVILCIRAGVLITLFIFLVYYSIRHQKYRKELYKSYMEEK
ncbi:hypothetical protein [Eisenbergiella tayi]|nr:hypothetical protein [Eisenbergiella tayi]